MLSSPGRYVPRISKTETLNLRIDPELKAAASRAAEEDRRSLTAYIEKLIEDDLHAREANRAAAPKRGRPK
jgi:predicted HicB family RNase H-like nuclease